MNITLKYLVKGALALSMVMMVSCISDDADFAQPENVINPNDGVSSDANSGDGYLSIGGLSVAINPDSELMVASRASSYDQAGDDYLIFIFDEEMTTEYYRGSYSAVKSLTEPLVLPVGNYLLFATSIEEVPQTSWDDPQYASSYCTFSIGAEKTTEYTEEIVCSMSNIKTSVELSADLKALFKADEDLDLEAGDIPLQVTLDYGDANILYSSSEDRNGYFAQNGDYDTIEVTMSGMYNTAAEGEEPVYAAIEWKQNISSVSSGQARYISVEIAHYNDGVLEVQFVVTSWIYDETLGVQMSKSFYTSYEDSIYDPDSDASDPYSPVLTLDGEEGVNFYVYPDMFDGESYSPTFVATMTPQSGSSVSEAMVLFTSTNEELTTALNEGGYSSTVTLWSDESANEELSPFVTMAKDSSTGVLTATITYEGMKSLSDYRGTHTAKTIVTDSEGRRSVTNVMIYSVASGVLDIVWQPGEDGTEYSFDNTYEIMYTTDDNYVELPVVFDITSKTGLTKLNIDINSSVLTPDELAGMNLSQSMDLINPATDEMKASLEELGFPVGEDLEGSTQLTFDITTFMPLLAMLSKEGSKDATSFVITAGDASGECIKTLSVVRK